MVLLILAGISINLLFSDDGIIKKASDAADAQNAAIEQDKVGLESLGQQANTLLNGGSSEATKTIEEIMSELPSNKNEKVVDKYGNKITIPVGFIVVANGTDNVSYSYTGDGKPSVQDGIVIQNETDGNQFVWVPVGTINNKSGDSRGATTTVKLGRYSDFTVTDGILPEPAQEATTSSYNTPVLISDEWEDVFEISDTFNGGKFGGLTYKAASSYSNWKSYNLQEWISTTLANGGYYIARYEAGVDDFDWGVPKSRSGLSVYENMTQKKSAEGARAMYPINTEREGLEYYSDLINSYAWDTAIVFIEAYSVSDYAIRSGELGVVAAGAKNDQVCNINDMSGNASEWTTESSYSDGNPAVYRAGSYYVGGVEIKPCALTRVTYRSNNFVLKASYRATLCVK